MEYYEQQFINGFNSGYLLAKHEPEMLTSLLSKISSINSYISGMRYGKKEYELEYRTNQLNEIGKLRNKAKEDRERN